MAKLNFDPWFDFKQLARQMERAAGRELGLSAPSGLGESAAQFTPAADVIETDEAVLVLVELAGATPEEVNLEVKDGYLWIYGEREACCNAGAYRVLERPYGRFLRRFELPKSVVRSKISAAMHNGLLEVTLPKRRPEELRRRIAVK